MAHKFKTFMTGKEPNLPDVTQDALEGRMAPLAKMPEGLSIGDFINSNIKKVDQHHHDNVDDVRHYNVSGDEISVAASLSSLASESSKSDIPFDYENDWCQRFEKIAQIYRRESDQDEDSEYEFPDFPKEKKTAPRPATAITKTKKPSVSFASPEPVNCYALAPPLKKNVPGSPSSTPTSPRLGRNSVNQLLKRDGREPGASILKVPSKSSVKVNTAEDEGQTSTPVKECRENVSLSNITRKKCRETRC